MKIAVFSTKAYDRRFLTQANAEFDHDLHFFESKLDQSTMPLAREFPCVCVFVNDQLDRALLQQLADGGTSLIALRSAGYNHVDLAAAQALGLTVVRVPAYSPQAVAEHTLALLLALSRKIHRAYNRVRDGNFALEGLLGFNLNEKVVGVIGTGKIGEATCRILQGFGCELLGYDPYPNPACTDLGLRYTELDELFASADVVTLHCPLTIETTHLINRHTISLMQPGGIIVNTSRGGLIDTRSLIHGLKTQHVRGVALDVYEEEASLFFTDHSEQAIPDDVFARLLTFPNVLITGHQGFFTSEALTRIAETTVANAQSFRDGNWVAANVVRA